MQTTIQISDKTLQVLRKLKEETHSSSYDETLGKILLQQTKAPSLAGFLGKKPLSSLMKDLREKHDRI